jgi:hypothetical protein
MFMRAYGKTPAVRAVCETVRAVVALVPSKIAGPVKVVVPVPIVTAPVDVLNAPDDPEKSLAVAPDAVTPAANVASPLKMLVPAATSKEYAFVIVTFVPAAGAPDT